MNLVKMSERQRLELKKKCLRSLYCFCKAVMGYDEITDDLHGDLCYFLERDYPRKQVTMPRSYVKTWTSSIAYPIWITLKRTEEEDFPIGIDPSDKFWQLGPNMRILIASYVISNSEKMIGFIRKVYESTVAMQMLFPEVIPINFNKVKWSNQMACIRRDEEFTEQTFEAGGIGGSTTSRHYDLIVEDDLVYANKDDFTDQELQPSKDDIDKAIGWHKLASSLLVPGKHTRRHNTGTRWAKYDLVDYIWKHEKHYKKFVRGCVDLEELEQKGDWRECRPTWRDCYDIEQLEKIYVEQGRYMFATQYLLQPSAPEEHLFKPETFEFYSHRSEIPTTVRNFTTVDLSGWTEPKRKAASRAVIITWGWCAKHHMWLQGYTIGRLNPTQVITAMAWHWENYHPETIGVESVYYQDAIGHFAQEYMDEGKVPRMTIVPLTPKGNTSKEMRIKRLEPWMTTHAVHWMREHKDWTEELEDYVPNSKLCKKDMLDASAYQFDIARPGKPIPIVQVRKPIGRYVIEMDEVMKKMVDSQDRRDVFGNPVVTKDLAADEHVVLIDPFFEGMDVG